MAAAADSELISRLSRAEAAAESLRARVLALEQRGASVHLSWASLVEQLSDGACTPGTPGDGSGPEKVRSACSRGLFDQYLLFHVPEELGYYSQELLWRAKYLKTPVEALCKTLLFRNTKCTRDDCSDWRNSRLYAVVTPYSRKVDAELLKRAVVSLWPLGSDGADDGGDESLEDRGERPGRGRYNFQLLDSCESPTSTGFPFNGVAPIGLAMSEIPLLVDASVAALTTGYFWAGGGNPHVKLLLPTAALCVPGVCVTADQHSREVVASLRATSCYNKAAIAEATTKGDRPRVIVADFTVAR